MAPALMGSPTKICSAADARTGVGAAEPIAMRACVHTPPPTTVTATFTLAIASAVFDTLRNAPALPATGAGTASR